jgi:hypothetical protein
MSHIIICKAVYLTDNRLVCQKNFDTQAEAVAFITGYQWARVLKIDDNRSVTDVTPT